jgi:hypothetical protein
VSWSLLTLILRLETSPAADDLEQSEPVRSADSRHHPRGVMPSRRRRLDDS